jgi:hypothetical protein
MSSDDIDDTLVASTPDSSLALNISPVVIGAFVDFDEFKSKHWDKTGDSEKKFRGYIYERMRERGWSREEYARERLNISGSRLSNILVGKQIDCEQADRIQDDLDIDVSHCRRSGNLRLNGRRQAHRPIKVVVP